MQNPTHGWWIALSGLILALGLVASTYIAATAVRDVKMSETSMLTVTGAAQQLITSDAVKWRASFTRSTAPTRLADGYAAMKKDQEIVTKYLQDNGVKDEEVSISPVSMSAVTQNCGAGAPPTCTNDIVSYRLSQSVQVNSSRVQQITALARDPSPIVAQGVIFSNGGLEYYYNKLAELRVQMLADATKDAQLRAQKMAESTGARVGHLVSVSSGVFQIQPVNSTQTSNEGSYDTSTIEKQITAVVRASFGVE
jgi:uncharacterized protein